MQHTARECFLLSRCCRSFFLCFFVIYCIVSLCRSILTYLSIGGQLETANILRSIYPITIFSCWVFRLRLVKCWNTSYTRPPWLNILLGSLRHDKIYDLQIDWFNQFAQDSREPFARKETKLIFCELIEIHFHLFPDSIQMPGSRGRSHHQPCSERLKLKFKNFEPKTKSKRKEICLCVTLDAMRPLVPAPLPSKQTIKHQFVVDRKKRVEIKKTPWPWSTFYDYNLNNSNNNNRWRWWLWSKWLEKSACNVKRDDKNKWIPSAFHSLVKRHWIHSICECVCVCVRCVCFDGDWTSKRVA